MHPFAPEDKTCKSAASSFEQDGMNMAEAMTNASLTAIEMRDPSTKDHSERVAVLTVALAKAASKKNTGPYSGILFSPLQIEEIRYAALLHDFGKIGVREEVLSKKKKFYPHQLEKIHTRFSQIKDKIYIKFLEGYIEKLISQKSIPSKDEFNQFTKEAKNIAKDIDQTWQVIEELNEPNVSAKEVSAEINKIADMKIHLGKTATPLLMPDEIECLKIPRGSLNAQERLEIQSHVTHSYEFLVQLPWSKDFQQLPNIVLSHHERLNGSGYPRNLTSENIPFQAKILALADVYDALVAYDRPYKSAVTNEQAFHILELEVKAGKLDEELYAIFREEKIYDLISKHTFEGSRTRAAG